MICPTRIIFHLYYLVHISDRVSTRTHSHQTAMGATLENQLLVTALFKSRIVTLAAQLKAVEMVGHMQRAYHFRATQT